MQTFCTPKNLKSLEIYKTISWDHYTDINVKMRAIMCDWLLEVSLMLKLSQNTMFLTFAILDEWLANQPNKDLLRTKLQMYGLASLSIASKMSEYASPSMSDYVFVSDNAYDKNEMIEAEKTIFLDLGGRVNIKTSLNYLTQLLNSHKITITQRCIAKTLLVTYQIGKSCHYRSLQATACLLLSSKMVENGFYINLYDLDESSVMNCAKDIRDIVVRISISALTNSKKYCKRVWKCLLDEATLKNINLTNGKSNDEKPQTMQKCIDMAIPLIERTIGEGTYGCVHKVIHNGEVCAYKEFKYVDDEGLGESFCKEVSIMLELSHSNIIPIIALVDVKGFLMPMLDCDLRKYYENNNSLIFQTDFTKQLLDAISYMHSIGIIHRDLKPQNILVNTKTNPPTLKLCDFGICKSMVVNTPYNVHMTDQICTLWYRPPDILLGANTYDEKLDIWSLGCILFEMFHKTPLFAGDCSIDTLFKVFYVFGTPKNNGLPYFQHCFPKFKGIDFVNELSPFLNNNIKIIITNCLKMIPSERISAKDAYHILVPTQITTPSKIFVHTIYTPPKFTRTLSIIDKYLSLFVTEKDNNQKIQIFIELLEFTSLTKKGLDIIKQNQTIKNSIQKIYECNRYNIINKLSEKTKQIYP